MAHVEQKFRLRDPTATDRYSINRLIEFSKEETLL